MEINDSGSTTHILIGKTDCHSGVSELGLYFEGYAAVISTTYSTVFVLMVKD